MVFAGERLAARSGASPILPGTISGMANRLADRGGTIGEVSIDHPLFAPAFVAEPSVRDALLREPEVGRTIGRYADLTLAVVGIGAMPHDGREASSSLLRSGEVGCRIITASGW